MNLEKGTRARPMTIEQRREMIATAAIPLFVEHGSSVTTRQLADYLAIAEGTIFRAYGDKETLVRAVVDAFFEQASDYLIPELTNPNLGLEEKLQAIIRQARARAKGMFSMLTLLDPSEAREYMKHRRETHFEDAAAEAFASDASFLNVPSEKLGALIRLIVIAASAPRLGGGVALSDEELVDFALFGIMGHPRYAIYSTDNKKKG